MLSRSTPAVLISHSLSTVPSPVAPPSPPLPAPSPPPNTIITASTPLRPSTITADDGGRWPSGAGNGGTIGGRQRRLGDSGGRPTENNGGFI